MVQRLQRQQLSRQALRQRLSRQRTSRQPTQFSVQPTDQQAIPSELKPLKRADEFAITSSIRNTLNIIKQKESNLLKWKRANPAKSSSDFRGSRRRARIKARKFNSQRLQIIRDMNSSIRRFKIKNVPRWFRETGNFKKFETIRNVNGKIVKQITRDVFKVKTKTGFQDDYKVFTKEVRTYEKGRMVSKQVFGVSKSIISRTKGGKVRTSSKPFLKESFDFKKGIKTTSATPKARRIVKVDRSIKQPKEKLPSDLFRDKRGVLRDKRTGVRLTNVEIGRIRKGTFKGIFSFNKVRGRKETKTTFLDNKGNERSKETLQLTNRQIQGLIIKGKTNRQIQTINSSYVPTSKDLIKEGGVNIFDRRVREKIMQKALGSSAVQEIELRSSGQIRVINPIFGSGAVKKYFVPVDSSGQPIFGGGINNKKSSTRFDKKGYLDLIGRQSIALSDKDIEQLSNTGAYTISARALDLIRKKGNGFKELGKGFIGMFSIFKNTKDIKGSRLFKDTSLAVVNHIRYVDSLQKLLKNNNTTTRSNFKKAEARRKQSESKLNSLQRRIFKGQYAQATKKVLESLGRIGKAFAKQIVSGVEKNLLGWIDFLTGKGTFAKLKKAQSLLKELKGKTKLSSSDVQKLNQLTNIATSISKDGQANLKAKWNTIKNAFLLNKSFFNQTSSKKRYTNLKKNLSLSQLKQVSKDYAPLNSDALFVSSMASLGILAGLLPSIWATVLEQTLIRAFQFEAIRGFSKDPSLDNALIVSLSFIPDIALVTKVVARSANPRVRTNLLNSDNSLKLMKYKQSIVKRMIVFERKQLALATKGKAAFQVIRIKKSIVKAQTNLRNLNKNVKKWHTLQKDQTLIQFNEGANPQSMTPGKLKNYERIANRWNRDLLHVSDSVSRVSEFTGGQISKLKTPKELQKLLDFKEVAKISKVKDINFFRSPKAQDILIKNLKKGKVAVGGRFGQNLQQSIFKLRKTFDIDGIVPRGAKTTLNNLAKDMNNFIGVKGRYKVVRINKTTYGLFDSTKFRRVKGRKRFTNLIELKNEVNYAIIKKVKNKQGVLIQDLRELAKLKIKSISDPKRFASKGAKDIKDLLDAIKGLRKKSLYNVRQVKSNVFEVKRGSGGVGSDRGKFLVERDALFTDLVANTYYFKNAKGSIVSIKKVRVSKFSSALERKLKRVNSMSLAERVKLRKQLNDYVAKNPGKAYRSIKTATGMGKEAEIIFAPGTQFEKIFSGKVIRPDTGKAVQLLEVVVKRKQPAIRARITHQLLEAYKNDFLGTLARRIKSKNDLLKVRRIRKSIDKNLKVRVFDRNSWGLIAKRFIVSLVKKSKLLIEKKFWTKLLNKYKKTNFKADINKLLTEINRKLKGQPSKVKAVKVKRRKVKTKVVTTKKVQAAFKKEVKELKSLRKRLIVGYKNQARNVGSRPELIKLNRRLRTRLRSIDKQIRDKSRKLGQRKVRLTKVITRTRVKGRVRKTKRRIVKRKTRGAPPVRVRRRKPRKPRIPRRGRVRKPIRKIIRIPRRGRVRKPIRLRQRPKRAKVRVRAIRVPTILKQDPVKELIAVIESIKKKKFIYIPDLYSRLYGIKASAAERRFFLSKNRVFTGLESRKLVK